MRFSLDKKYVGIGILISSENTQFQFVKPQRKTEH